VVVKSFNNGRMKENLEIFNWTLSEEEPMMISEIP
jgi:diketogulonate reductase-like aldo/keto reductase